MADKPLPPSSISPSVPPVSSPGEPKPAGVDAGAAAPTGRSIGQRTSDARDAMAEMAERAQLISQEAGTKIAAAMKDVIGAAAGIAGFAVESARDLVQYMVRRGQMTQDEADKLIKEAEEAHGRRGGDRGASGAKPSPNKPAVKTERSREASPRDDSKPATNTAKRASGASAAAKPEKKTARRAAAPKKAAKPAAGKKKR